jgi:putative oxidoreductase
LSLSLVILLSAGTDTVCIEGCVLQRLFSTFPTGGPGAGLLLLRLAVGTSLILEKIPAPWLIPQSLGFGARVAVVCVGVCLLCGLWTPVVASIAAAIELLITFSPAGVSVTHILLLILSVSLALLGPGAYSVDAHIFGRKRIDIQVG